QRAGREQDLLGQPGVDAAQAAGDPDGLVVAALHAVHHLLVLAEITRQVGPAEFVVGGRATERAPGPDLQGAGDVLGLAARLVGQAAPELAHRKAREARLGLGAAAGGAFVADLTAGAGGSTRERRDRRRVVVRLHLHEHVVRG